jgi:hypothetical protein
VEFSMLYTVKSHSGELKNLLTLIYSPKTSSVR